MRQQLALEAWHWRLGAAMAIAIAVTACAPAPQTSQTPAAGSAMTRNIVDPYLQIQKALSDDSTEGIHANAASIVTAATTLGAPAMKIDGAAMQLVAASEAATPDLSDVRDKFGALSDAIDTYMTGEHLTPPEGVKIAFCPMAHKPWMQEGTAISNPYYGKEMPTCGDFR
jgi:hypothetical protein